MSHIFPHWSSEEIKEWRDHQEKMRQKNLSVALIKDLIKQANDLMNHLEKDVIRRVELEDQLKMIESQMKEVIKSSKVLLK